LTVVIGKDKMVKRAEVGLLGMDGYIKMIEKALGKGSFFLNSLYQKAVEQVGDLGKMTFLLSNSLVPVYRCI